MLHVDDVHVLYKIKDFLGAGFVRIKIAAVYIA
jgi:hypothetical protein